MSSAHSSPSCIGSVHVPVTNPLYLYATIAINSPIRSLLLLLERVEQTVALLASSLSVQHSVLQVGGQSYFGLRPCQELGLIVSEKARSRWVGGRSGDNAAVHT
jgi:hypothetical protein